MGVFAKDPRKEEQPGGGSGLEVDLDLRACAECGRELHPWQTRCPDDGGPAVARADVAGRDLPPIPASLLDDDDDDDADAG